MTKVPMLVPVRRVRVHCNLNRGGLSVTVGRHVAAVVPDIALVAVTFHVQADGVARIRREHGARCAHPPPA